MKKLLATIFSLATLTVFSQPGKDLVKYVNPASIARPKGYSATVQIDLGNCRMILISGQVPLDKQGDLVGKDNFAQQAQQTFSNIKSIVEDAGGTMGNIVKINYYITDMSKLQVLRDTRDKFINTQNPPASTLVQVSKLFRDDVMLEIEATAILPKK
ncbi:MAG: RidA family protein [Bacteroidota bacterium]|nr:RidA family protein [Bacteroidota bacterium]